MRAIFIKGESDYSVSRFFIEKIAEDFSRRGHEAIVIEGFCDVSDKQIIEQFNKAIQKKVDFVFSVCGMYCDLKTDSGAYLWDALDTFFVNVLFDHPVYHLKRLKTPLSKSIVFCVDSKHCEYLLNYFGREHFSLVSFLPHFGDTLVDGKIIKNKEAFQKLHKQDILFAGTFGDMEELPIWQKSDFVLGKKVAEVLEDVKDLVCGEELISLEDALQKVLQLRSLFVSGRELGVLYRLLIYIDRFVRQNNRKKLLMMLAEKQIETNICGTGWDDCLFKKYRNFHYCGIKSYKELLLFMSEHKIFLNDNANFSHGAHDRVLDAMLSGTVAVTAESVYYNQNFQDMENIVTFNWQKLENLAEKIKLLKSSFDLQYKIALNAEKNAKKEHSLKKRVDLILEKLETIKMLKEAIIE